MFGLWNKFSNKYCKPYTENRKEKIKFDIQQGLEQSAIS